MELYFSFLTLLLWSYNVSGQTCWDSKWYNESATLKNGSSYEHQSFDILNNICHDKTSVIDAHCKDEKKEPFTTEKNDTVNKYYAVCNSVIGLICHPYENVTNATCPDFAIQYGCKCPPTTHTRGSIATKIGGIAATDITTSPSEDITGTPSSKTTSSSVAMNASAGTGTTIRNTGNEGDRNSTGNGGSVTSAHRHHCRNRAQRLENVNVGILFVLSMSFFRFFQ